MNISVIIPVYNAAAFLEKAVESASQFEEVKEIILVEDRSTDNSLILCEKIAANNPKIKIYQHADFKNQGAAASRNVGLEKASQEFIAFLDADDYYLPNRFTTEHELFENEKIEGVFGAIGTEFLTEKGKKEFQKKFKNVALTSVKKAAEGSDVFYGLLGLDNSFGTFFHLNGLTVRTSSIRENQLKFNENLRVHQDSDFIIKLAYHCYLKSGNILEAVAVRGVHDDNRITKITTYSQKYNERQFLLWNSILKWSRDFEIKKEYKEHIYLKKTSYEISCEKGISKYYKLLTSLISNPKILKTRYRFTYLQK